MPKPAEAGWNLLPLISGAALTKLSHCLLLQNGISDALAQISRSVTLGREIVASGRLDDLDALGAALNLQGLILGALGQQEAAVESGREALQARRKLVSEGGNKYRSALAQSPGTRAHISATWVGARKHWKLRRKPGMHMERK